MLGWPGTEWAEAPPEDPPIETEWQTLPGEVRHTFTHFHLILTLQASTVGPEAMPIRGQFMPRAEFRPSDLPTVMRKAFDLWQAKS